MCLRRSLLHRLVVLLPVSPCAGFAAETSQRKTKTKREPTVLYNSTRALIWSATERDHVIYESRLELANLILADFDPTVHHVLTQPFQLTGNVDGEERRHILVYLWGSYEKPVVVDVVRAERMTNPRIVRLCAWTKEVVESLGWSYLVWMSLSRLT